MILISYIAIGSLVFSELLNLTFQNGLYFTVVTIESEFSRVQKYKYMYTYRLT